MDFYFIQTLLIPTKYIFTPLKKDHLYVQTLDWNIAFLLQLARVENI